MLLVGIVLAVVFTAVCVDTYSGQKTVIERSLQLAIMQTENTDSGKLEIGGHNGGDGNGPFSQNAVVVFVDSDGNIKASYQENVYMSQTALKNAVDIVCDGTQSSGRISSMDLYYLKESYVDGSKIAFADSTYLERLTNRTILASVLLFMVSMVIFFFISLLLARYALRPVQKAWDQQQQFVADASHELKTPLTVILANNNILLSHKKDTVEKQQHWIESTEEEASHMRKLVDDMLFLAKSDNTQVKLVMSDMDISEIIQNAFLQFEPVAFEKKVTLDQEIEKGVFCRCDPVQIRQLAHILLDNACKYAGEEGKVCLRLKKQNDSIIFSVSNTGESIAGEDMPHIFERFYRSDKARTREGGYGLGLAIAKSIVSRHGGKIEVKSSAEKGTEILVTLSQQGRNRMLQR